MKLSLQHPVTPFVIVQPFGANPDYYAKFLDKNGNPEKGHMGVDLMASHGQPVYAPIDGVAQHLKDEHGGEGVYIHCGPFEYAGGEAYFNVIHWHIIGDTDPAYPPKIPVDGTKVPVKAGDLIAYANNTGAPFESSGDHLHFGLVPVDVNNTQPLFLNNGFNGCIDPQNYFVSTSYISNSFPDDLYYGMYSEAVSRLQVILVEKGYLMTTDFGHFGPKTEEAVKQFQLANNLPATGYVGRLTRGILNNQTTS